MQKSLRLWGITHLMPAAGLMIAAVACGGSQPPAQQPRVYFAEPKDGATVKSPVHLVFGIEGYQIQPVPQGTVAPEAVRPGVGHHHLGIDQDCLPAGTEIVKGTPSWVHFGDGKDVFDTQLTPGKHKLALQLGDDLHNTMPGTCQVITVTVK